VPVVADRHRSRGHQLTELRELFPLLAESHGTDGVDARGAGCRPLLHDEPDRRLIVDRRIRVRHGADAREATGGRGHGPRGNGLAVLLARLAQMGVDIDETGRDHQPAHIAYLRALWRALVAAHARNAAVGNQHVVHVVEIA
jgi:hypothetical protein